MDVPSTHSPTLQRSAITIDALVVDESVQVTLDDARSEATQLFAELPEPQQRRLAEEAWQIGLRALGNAQAQARESKLEDIGKTLLGDVDAAMKRHVAGQLDAVESAMARFFDPKDGEVNRRMQAFLADDGMLDRLLTEQLTGEHSQLARTLASQVGEHSELFSGSTPTTRAASSSCSRSGSEPFWRRTSGTWPRPSTLPHPTGALSHAHYPPHADGRGQQARGQPAREGRRGPRRQRPELRDRSAGQGV